MNGYVRRYVLRVGVAGALATMGALLLAAAPHSTSTRSAAADQKCHSVAERVQAALGIKPSGADILTPLAEVIRTFAGKDEAAKQTALKALVDALLKGAEPDALAKSLKQAARLGNYIGSPADPKWPYGSWMDRFHLKRLLVAKAKQQQHSNPAEAARLAKAAILLAAHEGAEPSLQVLRGDWEILLRIAGLDDAARADMTKVLDEEQTATSEYSDRVVEVLKLHDRVLDLDPSRPIPHDVVKDYIEVLTAVEPAAVTPQRRFEAVFEAWQLRLFALAHKDPHCTEAVDGLLRRWREELAQDDVERAWIDDALAKTGPRPSHRRITILKEDDPRARQLAEPTK